VRQEWTERAEEFDLEVRGGLGGAAAELFGGAWRARVDLEALGALAGAVIALGQRPSVIRPRERGDVLPSDREMREHAEDLEADASDLLRAGAQMNTDCTRDWQQACDDLRKAQAAMKAAQKDDVRAEAEHAARMARDRMADCEVALEILGEAGSRLQYALGCLERVPDDLEVTYEAAYALRRRGIALPADGDFLTGTPVTPADSRHATVG
jgi:hypothetical protein